MRAEVVVIGAGLAGLTAAVRLAESGRKVLLISKGVGSTHLSSGTIDVLGYAPDRVRSPAETLPGFVGEHPEHPYAKVGVEGIGAAVAWLSERFGYRGGLEENWLLPTAVGAIKPTALAPASMTAGDLRSQDPVCVVGFRLRDFHPAYCADNLRRQGIPARGVTLEVPLQRADENAVGLANAFGDAEFRATVVRRLADKLEPGERVGFPAALGARDTAAVVGELEERLGHRVFEIPTLPPSVPGIRLHRALERALRSAGGRMAMHAEVTGVNGAEGRVLAVRAKQGPREVVHPVDWVVLASGGFGSGGIALDSRWRASETVLGLPLTGVPAPSEARFSAEYFAEHPISRAGVPIDDGLRPLASEGGARVYENVLVVGATVAGAVPWREKSGDGIALATGHRAAELIGRQAGVEVLAA